MPELQFPEWEIGVPAAAHASFFGAGQEQAGSLVVIQENSIS
jgi:hypothetical protein